jgi:hypothetical protein
MSSSDTDSFNKLGLDPALSVVVVHFRNDRNSVYRKTNYNKQDGEVINPIDRGPALPL